MRALYVHYGPQSGVTTGITRALSAAGLDLEAFDALRGFLWGRRVRGVPVPNPRPEVLGAVGAALRLGGRWWKCSYLHTTFAFDRLSARAAAAIRAASPDVVLQAGALFGPGPYPEVPYFLYLDHTRAIAERYVPYPGLPPPIPAERAWHAREQAVYRNATGIFTMSEFVRDSLRDDYGVDPRRVVVVGAGPNVVPGRAALEVAREPAFLFVGRMFAAKGGPDAVEAFERVRAQHPSARLWIVSHRPPPRSVAGVEWLGPLEPDALARRYARASVFVLPTLREAFGLAFLEAMAFGLPCVGTRIEAIPEIVSDGETGLLVPPRDPAALARAMSDLLGDPVRARLLGAAGRARVEARFGWDRAAAGIAEGLRPARARSAERSA
jgi:glycosyltransferase involved in cell wall biosynthesis